MHELSIARSIVRVSEDGAMEAGARRVRTVYLRLGPLAGVVREALDFAYDFATEGTLLEGSKLVIEPVPLIAHCGECDADVAPASTRRLRCPECDAPTPEIVSGRELLVRAIDYDDAEPAPSSCPDSTNAHAQSNPSRAAVTQPNPTT